MDLKFEEILKNIFPGLLLMAGAFYFFTGEIPFYNWKNEFPTSWKDFSAILLTLFLVVAYLVGYLNDMIASWVEDYMLFRITAKPTYLLLKQKTRKIFLNNQTEIFEKLSKTCKENITAKSIQEMTNEEAERIFQQAKSIADKKANETERSKLDIFYKSYNFSRNLLTALTIIFPIAFFKTWYQYNFSTSLISLTIPLLIGFLFYRWKERGLYYSRLILNIANSQS